MVSQSFTRKSKGDRPLPKPGRVALVTTICVGLLLGMVLFPVPCRVSSAVLVEQAAGQPIYVEVAGTLAEVHVRPGQQVRQGDVLAVLSNPELAAETAAIAYEVKRMAIYASIANANGDAGDRSRLEKSVADLEILLASKQAQLSQLTIRAPQDGIFIANPLPLNPQNPDGPLGTTALDQAHLGVLLETGLHLGLVGNTGEYEARAFFPQHDLEFIQQGQAVELSLDGLPWTRIKGHVANLGLEESLSFPAPLSTRTGGNLAAIPTGKEEDRFVEPHYQVLIALDEPPQMTSKLMHGLRGEAKIHAGFTTVLHMFMRMINLLFRF